MVKANPKPYEWDFDGACAPNSSGYGYPGQTNFSVGIFQWLPKKSGKGLKRGRVKYRVRGRLRESEQVLATARKMCAKYNVQQFSAKDGSDSQAVEQS